MPDCFLPLPGTPKATTISGLSDGEHNGFSFSKRLFAISSSLVGRIDVWLRQLEGTSRSRSTSSLCKRLAAATQNTAVFVVVLMQAALWCAIVRQLSCGQPSRAATHMRYLEQVSTSVAWGLEICWMTVVWQWDMPRQRIRLHASRNTPQTHANGAHSCRTIRRLSSKRDSQASAETPTLIKEWMRLFGDVHRPAAAS